MNIQVKRATDKNPLTGLPGNSAITKEVTECISADTPFSVIYIDIDNFKAYNDLYGFNNGDLMIKAVVSSISKYHTDGFIGHIGGDDFVIILKTWDIENLIQTLFKEFSAQITSLYSIEDCENGYIISKNRHGLTERFPLASLSAAVITNKNLKFRNIDEFSKHAAVAKKQCKQKAGNSYVII